MTELPALPVIIVLVLESEYVDPARLIELGESGPDHGVHLIWIARHRAALPAACRTFVDLGQAEGRVHFVRSGSIVPLSRLESVETPVAFELARRLAPVEDAAARVLDESDLPRAVQLRELHSNDLLGGAEPILRSWVRAGSIVAAWQPGQERAPVSLSAAVGQSAEGVALIDLRTQGPHALVGGTTGAGKSEFLQTWIMSMAASLSPDRLTFLMVDYKGGAAFAECVDLPHTVGLVTDLSPHLVRRALTSLRAEVQHREELLAAHGAKDLISMERRSNPAAPPILVIVIDEFAALAADVPEFVDGVIDIAQRGRSLGLHLVMATQRPAGVIKDNLRANTNLRVALRMADESDSTDVIGAADAAFFDADSPGRGAIKVGPGRITHFQAGYLGGRASQTDRTAEIEVRSLGFTEGDPWQIPVESQPPGHRKQLPRDIERLRDGIVEANRRAGILRPRRPWLDELPLTLHLDSLRHGMRCGAEGAGAEKAVAESSSSKQPGQGAEAKTSGGPLVGLCDDPAAQTQQPVAVNFEEVGNIAIVGAGGTGKTSALITLAASLSGDALRDPVQIYAIDAANGALDMLRTLPTVGAVASLSDSELVRRVLRRVADLIAERGPRYAAVRAGGLAAYRATAAMPAAPGTSAARAAADELRVFLLLDGFAAFRQSLEAVSGTENPFQLLSEILMHGRSVGVHAVITGDRPSAIPASMAASLQQQFSLRLSNPHDYGALGLRAEALENAPPGRAILVGDGRELQFACVGRDGGHAAQAVALDELAQELRRHGVARTPEIVNAPRRLPLCELPVGRAGRPVYGIDVRTLEPVTLPMRGLGVIAGPSGAGLSHAALSCVEAVSRFAEEEGERCDAVLLSCVENGLRHARAWDRAASSDEEVAELAGDLVRALGGKPAELRRGNRLGNALIGGMPASGGLFGDAPDPGSETGGATASDADPPLVFPAEGARGVIVVEGISEAEGSEALPHLVALAKAARRSESLVLFEYELGSASTVWDLHQALKQPGWGLPLQPDERESQSPFREAFGRVKRAEFPPGRGFAVEGGSSTAIHVALPASKPYLQADRELLR
ncbi:MAG: FtsK/SpoIIIE domain-containing protein [Leucobacter sp.]